MTALPQQSLAAVTTAPNVMELRRLDICKKVTLRGVMGVEYSAFRRAVDAIHSRRYPMERLHTHSFPIEEAERCWPH